METIIGLLVIILPFIFKAIEKKLQASGKLEQAGKVRELSEAFLPDEEEDDAGEEGGVAPFVPQVQVLPEPAVKEVPEKTSEASFQDYLDRSSGQGRTTLKPKNVAARPSVKPKKPVLKEEEPVKREKIDPRKLVVYSEIMKPKYEE